MPLAEVRTFCAVEAGIHYKIPADLIYAVSLNEGGNAGSKQKNANGTFDLGIMQFNTAYLKTLEKEGIKSSSVQKHGCYPFHLAAWRIKGHIDEDPSTDLFTKVAYYHSRTSKFNEIYRTQLIKNLEKFDRKLAKTFYDLIIERENVREN